MRPLRELRPAPRDDDEHSAHRVLQPDRHGDPRGRPGRIAPPSPDPPVATARAAREYVVRKGDTLWTIARQHGTTVEAIRLANRAVPQSAQLQLGQRLLITG